MLRFFNIFMVFCFFTTLIILNAASDADAASLEKDMSQSLSKCRALLGVIAANMDSGNPSGDEIERLESMSRDIRALHMLLNDRFAQRGDKVADLGPKAAARHWEMVAKYKDAFDRIIHVLDSIINEDGSISRTHVDTLIRFIDQAVPKRKRPIYGTLPYKHLNYPAVPPLREPAIVPAYLGGDMAESPEDLEGTPEAPVSRKLPNWPNPWAGTPSPYIFG